MEQENKIENATENKSIKINIRECKTFVADSGMKVEEYKIVPDLTINYTPKDENETKRIEEFGTKTFFFGTMVIGDASGSPREVKFSLPNSTTLEEAFSEFPKASEDVIENLKKQREDFMAKMKLQQQAQQSKIQIPGSFGKDMRKTDPETINKIKEQLNISED